MEPRPGEAILRELAYHAFRSGSAPSSRSIFDVVDVSAYHNWVHVKADGEGILVGGLLEPITRSPYWLPVVVWLPVAFIFACTAILEAPVDGALGVLFGVFAWTLLEYVLHRFIFHALDTFKHAPAWAVTIDFAIHSVHHRYPDDHGRLVMPLPLSAAIAVPTYIFLNTITSHATSIFAGILIGYVLYDFIHFLLHRGGVPKCLRAAVRRHARHHYWKGATDFGVTSSFWDVICGTISTKPLLPPRASPRSNNGTPLTSNPVGPVGASAG
jgi:sterol desaturase/sphingolipid hydroxylase (fatty acid hydroxylase superfamily)